MSMFARMAVGLLLFLPLGGCNSSGVAVGQNDDGPECAARLRFEGTVYRGRAFGDPAVRTERLPSRAGYVGCTGEDLPAVSFPRSRPWGIRGVDPHDGVLVHDHGTRGLTLYVRADLSSRDARRIIARAGRDR